MGKRWFREPLVHFLIIGTMIFVLFSVVNKEKDNSSSNKIVVTASDIDRLIDNWSRKWNRPPTESELSSLIDSYIREEVYYREALALGLDRNDTILRRRLMQKMEFLSNDLAELNAPDETELRQFFVENRDKYELPERINFTHIYFSVDRRGEEATSDAKMVLYELENSSGTVLRAPKRGDGFMLQNDFTRVTPSDVARLFGSRFADRLFESDMNAWQGPIESGYGLHLVRVSEKTASRMPEFSDVIDKVRLDWIFEHRKKTNEEIYRKLKERYEIVVEKETAQKGVARATDYGGGGR